MKVDFSCPLCASNSWTKHDIYTFNKGNHMNDSNEQNERHKQVALRQQILYRLWFPEKNEIQLTSIYCNNCGFMCYTPRPTENDLTIKYNYLSGKEKIGALNHPTSRGLQLIDKRAMHIFNLSKEFNVSGTLSVLDYGGGDGRLLKYFLRNQHDCYIVDYNDKPIDGVHRLGSVLSDIPKNLRFDLIICSHVLEHVDDPISILKGLHSFLKDDGIVYVEVPVEIWKGIPIRYDPVTHINFFTVKSLKAAMLLSSFSIKKIKYAIEPYDEKFKRVAWAVISKNNSQSVDLSSAYTKQTRQLLCPQMPKRVHRYLENILLQRVLNAPKTFENLQKLTGIFKSAK